MRIISETSDSETKLLPPLRALMEIFYIVFLFLFFLERMFVEITKWKTYNETIETFQTNITLYYKEYLVGALLVYILLCFALYKNVKYTFFGILLLLVAKRVQITLNDDYILISCMLIIAGYGKNARRIMKMWLCSSIILLLVTIYSSTHGYIENYILEPEFRHREYLGFTWTTTPVMIFTYSVFLWIIIRRGRIYIPDLIIINLINTWLFLKTNTRMAFIVVTFTTLFFTFYNKFSSTLDNNRVIKHIAVLSPWLSFIAVLVVSMSFSENNRILLRVNSLLSNRLRQTKHAILTYGIHPFGSQITWISPLNSTVDNPPTYVDSATAQTLLIYGYILLFLFLVLSTFLILKAYKKKNYVVAYVFVIIVIFGLTEQQLYWFEYDTVLLLTFSDWSSIGSRRPKIKEANNV